MNNKTIKISIIIILAIVTVLVAMAVYRMFFMFKRKKIKEYVTAYANETADPNNAFRLIMESCELILKSQDLCKSVCISAQIDGIEKENALVMAAVNNCYSLGFLAPPQTEEQEAQ